MRTVNEIELDIIAHPERDELRLEFAEQIYPHDPHRAQYISTFVARANPNWQRLDQAAIDAFKTRAKAPFCRFGEVSLDFDRGFPSMASMSPETFLAHGDEILSLAPILEVVLNLPYLDERGFRPAWNQHLPAVVHCPALARVRELRLGIGWCDFESVKHVIASPYIEKLLRLSVGEWWFGSPGARPQQQEDEMWPLLLESPVFRRMISWGVLGVTRRSLGDRYWKETHIEYDGPDRYTAHYEPMSEESRALEQRYGYIPCLHAGNWKATVLDVMRGIKPDYPAGATPTEEMYVVPPPEPA